MPLKNFSPIDLLRSLISVESISRQEDCAADLIFNTLLEYGTSPQRIGNNVWVKQPSFNSSRPTLLLNSHIDTVRPVASYTRNPFSPDIEEGKLYGLGSNDAGASVVSLINTFLKYYDAVTPVNIVLAITAQEEVMGEGGMRMFLPYLAECGVIPDMALVGEPTGMNVAVGERGLLVLDCVAHGKAGHVARCEGENALYKAIDDIAKLRDFRFERESSLLGPISMAVTMIKAGTQHNVVPDKCEFTVDVRTTDVFTNEEVVEIIDSLLSSDVTPRSTRVRASAIDEDHLLVRAAVASGAKMFVSPTTSDMALMPDIPSIKMGPGESSRSHKADEYIRIEEIDSACRQYVLFIENLMKYAVVE